MAGVTGVNDVIDKKTMLGAMIGFTLWLMPVVAQEKEAQKWDENGLGYHGPFPSDLRYIMPEAISSTCLGTNKTALCALETHLACSVGHKQYCGLVETPEWYQHPHKLKRFDYKILDAHYMIFEDENDPLNIDNFMTGDAYFRLWESANGEDYPFSDEMEYVLRHDGTGWKMIYGAHAGL